MIIFKSRNYTFYIHQLAGKQLNKYMIRARVAETLAFRTQNQTNLIVRNRQNMPIQCNMCACQWGMHII